MPAFLPKRCRHTHRPMIFESCKTNFFLAGFSLEEESVFPRIKAAFDVQHRFIFDQRFQRISMLSVSTDRNSAVTENSDLEGVGKPPGRVIRDTGSVKLETSRHNCLMMFVTPDALQILNLNHSAMSRVPAILRARTANNLL